MGVFWVYNITVGGVKMPVKPRVYLYPDEELKLKIEQSAKKNSLSVSSWLKLAAVEKLKRENK